MSSPRKSSFRSAFTLMEMMVAIGILVVLILGVGVIFQSVSKTVSVSQSSMQMLSGVRSIQRQLDEDLRHIDKDGFLVIRCKRDGSGRRYDQMSFMSFGSFPNKTGSATNTFTSTTTAPAAFIWWGQVVFEKGTAASPNPNYPITVNSGSAIPITQDPNGFIHYGSQTDADFALGRYTILLLPDVDPSIQEFVGNESATPPLLAIDQSVTLSGISITQSRISAAQMSPAQIMTGVALNAAPGGGARANPRFEADSLCYRHGVLTSPYDSTVSLVDGSIRMHPVALQGVSSIAIDWTDGDVYKATDIDVTTGNKVDSSLVGTTKWYGEYNASKGLAKGGSYSQTFVDRGVTSISTTVGANNGDDYTAIFSYDNRPQWPVALRVRYHVVDYSLADYRTANSNGQLSGGRDFVQVIRLSP